MISFDATHPGMATVKVDMYWKPILHPDITARLERLIKFKPKAFN